MEKRDIYMGQSFTITAGRSVVEIGLSTTSGQSCLAFCDHNK